ncbi:carbohydrate ABC transporter permease [Paenibacillus flagellatus]|uniref:ABC transporter permease n=1 Tax=Paenibacillus flagellatus TaxID=2211139 RepID=A0A2V5KHG9_9BACL|nr:carbohydrate ABC transporter permease [Paenibacillus flagellatus]PYI53770.1 ABC transporter permease [Paenibacillus flagellatus]
MVEYPSLGRKLFAGFNYAFLLAMAVACLFPLVHVLAVSFSSSTAAGNGLVKLWPVGFNAKAYAFVLHKEAFLLSFLVSVKRVALGTLINVLMTVMIAYPLAKEANVFRFRTFYVWYFFVTVLFGGGLIPLYMIMKMTGVLDTVWALILPGAVPVFSILLMLNFFRTLPRDLEEAAFIDGAGHWATLWRVYVPLSAPGIATISLLSLVGHWNSWFDGIIYMSDPDHYPLQSYLQTVVIQTNTSGLDEQDAELMKELSNRTIKAAQIFLAALPILLVYPFLQKFFIKGVVLGSVKE